MLGITDSVSVLMSVYQHEKAAHLEHALHSIWTNQTLKPDEIILVEDGPLTCELYRVIDSWKRKLPEQFKPVKIKKNVGLASALNDGLQHCSHELVARMDTDDESLPRRIEEQVAYMTANPDIVACSAQLDEYDIGLTRQIGQRLLPLYPEELNQFCKTRSPLSHPVVMFRKSIVESIGGYPLFNNSQDWALWSLLIVNGHKIANIDSKLLKMRTDTSLLERRGAKYLSNEIKLYRYQNRIKLITRKKMLANIAQKSVLRLSPNFVKRYLYKKYR
ncbi:glycosyltransferase [Vibrio satsumensis]|uniref:glycosyltransferase n=1 Tax=Vibrio satsumensis TaxID=2910245 RepID=UPI003D09CCA3